MMEYEIAEIGLGAGAIGLGALPGLGGDYRADLKAILAWRPGMVLSLATQIEAERAGAGRLSADLGAKQIPWRRFAITDYGAPDAMSQELWPMQSGGLLAALGRGGRLFIHCRAGCGRSGMVALRLMVEAGEDPDAALVRLRAARPCAVETAAQMAWAIEG
jgi:protein-tyrosine phosphatase